MFLAQSDWAFCVISKNCVSVEEENETITIIVTHQGVEKLIDCDEPPNPTYVGLFQVK